MAGEKQDDALNVGGTPKHFKFDPEAIRRVQSDQRRAPAADGGFHEESVAVERQLVFPKSIRLTHLADVVVCSLRKEPWACRDCSSFPRAIMSAHCWYTSATKLLSDIILIFDESLNNSRTTEESENSSCRPEDRSFVIPLVVLFSPGDDSSADGQQRTISTPNFDIMDLKRPAFRSTDENFDDNDIVVSNNRHACLCQKCGVVQAVITFVCCWRMQQPRLFMNEYVLREKVLHIEERLRTFGYVNAAARMEIFDRKFRMLDSRPVRGQYGRGIRRAATLLGKVVPSFRRSQQQNNNNNNNNNSNNNNSGCNNNSNGKEKGSNRTLTPEKDSHSTLRRHKSSRATRRRSRCTAGTLAPAGHHIPEAISYGGQCRFEIGSGAQQAGGKGQPQTLMPDSFYGKRQSTKRSTYLAHPASAVSCGRQRLVLSEMEPNELADQLTVVEMRTLRRITDIELKEYAKKATPCSGLASSVRHTNGLTRWIQASILVKSSCADRAQLIDHFILLSKRLHELRNFNSLCAVVGALTHSSIQRLSGTWELVSIARQSELVTLSNELSSQNNFRSYRQQLKLLGSTQQFFLPCMGIHLKDLVHVNTMFPDYQDSSSITSDGGETTVDATTNDLEINLIKLEKLANTMFWLTYSRNQCLPLTIVPDEDSVRIIKTAFDAVHTDEEIYVWSVRQEPNGKMPKISGIEENKGHQPWFIDMVSTPNPEAVAKHIDLMVQVVFRHFDLDKDGFISLEEFEAVAANFPLLEHFSQVDTNSDGKVSQMELKNCLIKANTAVLKKAFTHQFQPKSIIRPTRCRHCKRTVWTWSSEQSLQCSKCGVVVHKNCCGHVLVICSTLRDRKRRVKSNEYHVSGGKHLVSNAESKPMRGNANHTNATNPLQTNTAASLRDSAKRFVKTNIAIANSYNHHQTNSSAHQNHQGNVNQPSIADNRQRASVFSIKSDMSVGEIVKRSSDSKRTSPKRASTFRKNTKSLALNNTSPTIAMDENSSSTNVDVFEADDMVIIDTNNEADSGSTPCAMKQSSLTVHSNPPDSMIRDTQRHSSPALMRRQLPNLALFRGTTPSMATSSGGETRHDSTEGGKSGGGGGVSSEDAISPSSDVFKPIFPNVSADGSTSSSTTGKRFIQRSLFSKLTAFKDIEKRLTKFFGNGKTSNQVDGTIDEEEVPVKSDNKNSPPHSVLTSLAASIHARRDSSKNGIKPAQALIQQQHDSHHSIDSNQTFTTSTLPLIATRPPDGVVGGVCSTMEDRPAISPGACSSTDSAFGGRESASGTTALTSTENDGSEASNHRRRAETADGGCSTHLSAGQHRFGDNDGGSGSMVAKEVDEFRYICELDSSDDGDGDDDDLTTNEEEDDTNNSKGMRFGGCDTLAAGVANQRTKSSLVVDLIATLQQESAMLGSGDGDGTIGNGGQPAVMVDYDDATHDNDLSKPSKFESIKKLSTSSLGVNEVLLKECNHRHFMLPNFAPPSTSLTTTPTHCPLQASFSQPPLQHQKPAKHDDDDSQSLHIDERLDAISLNAPNDLRATKSIEPGNCRRN